MQRVLIVAGWLDYKYSVSRLQQSFLPSFFIHKHHHRLIYPSFENSTVCHRRPSPHALTYAHGSYQMKYLLPRIPE